MSFGRYSLIAGPLLAITLIFTNPHVSSVAFAESRQPRAQAGRDQTVVVGATVYLNGAASNDPEGHSLRFQWTLASSPSGSNAALTQEHSVTPQFVADRPGNFVLNLVVSDGITSSPADTVVISTTNSVPVAESGPDQTVSVGSTVHLTGSGSSDMDGQLLTYQWAIISSPAGSHSRLSSEDGVLSSFVADVPGEYVVRLITNDGLETSQPDLVTIRTTNSLPTANAGPDRPVAAGSTVRLNGSRSTDVDGDLLAFSWSFVTRPEGSTAELSNPSGVMPVFTADVAGEYVLQLMVNDGLAYSMPDTVRITTTANTAPEASAGVDQKANIGAPVQLNGMTSFDAEGAELRYNWSLLSKPRLSASVLSNSNSATPSLVPDKPGTYVAQLIVNDGSLTSAADTVTIDTARIAPIANAGRFQRVHAGSTVFADGRASSGADGVALNYLWAVLSRPAGSEAVLTNATSASPDFVADRSGFYVLQLITNDGVLSSAPDTVVIAARKDAPIANAGNDGSGPTGVAVQMDGTASSDPNGGALTYSWTIASAPEGSKAGLQNAASSRPVLTPDVNGPFALNLTVNNGAEDSSTDTVIFTAGLTESGAEDGGMANGFLHTGAIAGPGEVDTWTFTANAGDRIAVHIGEITDNNDFRPWIRLISPGGASLGSHWGTVAAALGDVLAPATGTYQVLVASYDSGYDGTGSYRLTMTHTPGPLAIASGDQGGPLTAGATHAGGILPGDLDVWAFTATAGERLAVHIGETLDRDDFRPWIRVWAPNGASLGGSYGTAAAEVGDVIAPVSGRYLVLVGSYDTGYDGSGTYRLTFTRSSGSPVVSDGDQGGAISNGGLHTGGIFVGDLDIWTFEAAAGQRIGVHIGEITDASDFRPWIRLWAPNGTYLSGSYGTGAGAIGDAIAPVTGTYQILVGSYDTGYDGAGTYRITMTKSAGPVTVSEEDQGGPLTNAGIHTGELLQGDLDVWTFSATAGQRIGVHIGQITDGSDFRPWIRLWAPNGTSLGGAYGTDAAAIGDVVAPVTGMYLVLVGSYDTGYDGFGTYRLNIVKSIGGLTISSGDQGGPISNGGIHTGEILQGDIDVWSFEASAGDRIGVNVGEIVESDDFRPWIRLWTPSGALLSSGYGVAAASIGDVVAPTTGRYLIVVASYDSGYDGEGTYRINAVRTPGPITTNGNDQGGALTNGGIHTGEIVRGDLDIWTFEANAGERVTVHAGEITDIDDFRPWLRVWSPSGASVAATYGTDAAAGEFVAPTTGLYLVVLGSYDSGYDGRGTYRVNLAKSSGAITVSGGDEGGPMANGSAYNGAVIQGDIDVWSFTANAGQKITVLINETGEIDDFRPWIRVWTPTGALLGSSAGTTSAQVGQVTAPATGRYVVVVGSYDSGYDGVGSYQLTRSVVNP